MKTAMQLFCEDALAALQPPHQYKKIKWAPVDTNNQQTIYLENAPENQLEVSWYSQGRWNKKTLTPGMAKKIQDLYPNTGQDNELSSSNIEPFNKIIELSGCNPPDWKKAAVVSKTYLEIFRKMGIPVVLELHQLVDQIIQNKNHAGLAIPFLKAFNIIEVGEGKLNANNKAEFIDNMAIALRRAVAFGYATYVNVILQFNEIYTTIPQEVIATIYNQKPAQGESKNAMDLALDAIDKAISSNSDTEQAIIILFSLLKANGTLKLGLSDDLSARIIELIEKLPPEEMRDFHMNLMKNSLADNLVYHRSSKILDAAPLITEKLAGFFDYNKSFYKISLDTPHLNYQKTPLRRIRIFANKEFGPKKMLIELTTQNNEKIFLTLQNLFYAEIIEYLVLSKGTRATYEPKLKASRPGFWQQFRVVDIYASTQNEGTNAHHYYTNIHYKSALRLNTIITEKWSTAKKTAAIISFGCGNGEDLQIAREIIKKNTNIDVNLVAGFDINQENISEAKMRNKGVNQHFSIGNLYKEQEVKQFLQAIHGKQNNQDVTIVMAQGILTADISNGSYQCIQLVQLIYKHFQQHPSTLILQIDGLEAMLVDNRMLKAAGFKMSSHVSFEDQQMVTTETRKALNPICFYEKQSPEERLKYLEKRALNADKHWDLSMSSEPVWDITLLLEKGLEPTRTIDCRWSAMSDEQVTQLLTKLEIAKPTLIYSGVEPWSKTLEQQAPNFGITLEKRAQANPLQMAPLSEKCMERFSPS
jgi:hypothetical protein